MNRTRALAALGASCILGCCLLPHSALADSTIEFFEGGSLSSSFDVSLGFLYSAGARPGGLGTPTSTLEKGPASASSNPAGLAFLDGNGLLLDFLPPVAASISDIADLESRTARAVDDALGDAADPGLEPGYPTLDASAGQQAGVISGAAAFRVGSGAAALAIEEPLAIRLDLVETGIEALGEGVTDEGQADVRLRCFGDASIDLSFDVERTTFAAAWRVGRPAGVGASVSLYRGRASVDGVVRGDGIVSYGGQEYAFNDPSDLWENSLGGSAAGSFEGTAWGWSAGASWRPHERLTLDLLWTHVPELGLAGDLVTVKSMSPAIDGGDLDVDEIPAAQPTLTETTTEIHDGPFVLLLPSSVGVSATTRVGPVHATLEYRRYAGVLGFRYEDYEEGLRLSDGLGCEARVGGLWFGGGFIRGELIGESADQGDDGVTIPLANLGMGFDVARGTRIDVMFLALPLQVARASLSYAF